ncbi:MAG: hypothetical protein M1839_006168 [Geoglossum umbratile]|nr:MAG: hypothetical protein M1839_006168 [Geoglossum umbratile]
MSQPSLRKRQRTTYTIDPFEGHDLLEGDALSERDSNLSEGNETEDEYSGNSAASADGNSDGQINSEDSDRENSEDPEYRVEGGTAQDGTRSRRRRVHLLEDENRPAESPENSYKGHPKNPRYRDRGNYSHKGKRDRLTDYFGRDTKDLIDAMRCRDKWCDNPTIPTRYADERGSGGLAYSFFYSQEQRDYEATEGWAWYIEGGGRDRLRRRQKTRNLTDKEGSLYLPKPESESHRVLLGPKDAQKLVLVGAGKAIGLRDSWGEADDMTREPTSQKDKTQESQRDGWIFNISAKVLCMDWLPSQPSGTQYLALGTVLLAGGKDDTYSMGKIVSEGLGEITPSPAFAPAPPKSNCLQIWSFAVSVEPGKQVFDLNEPPRLYLGICTDWGDIKHFKWCPTQSLKAVENADGMVSFGLLAAIWGDGKLRVLDVQHREGRDIPAYVKYEKAAFEIEGQDTIFTCLAWLSNNLIAVGCANGFVAIFDLQHDPEAVPIPFFYQPLHQTYVLSIVSGYPSRSHLIITSSMDGYTRLTDIHAPQTDSLLSLRSRFGSHALAWCDPVQGVLIGEESDNTRVYPVRRFFSASSCVRHDGTVYCLAVGTAHPVVLGAGTDGDVIITNPLRRTVNLRLCHFQQTWFKHEYSPKSGGISRITEGYAPEKTSLSYTQSGRDVWMVEDGAVLVTIFEERSAVTQVCWNPNISFGGVAAAAMGSGLVRVEDLAI